MTVRGRDKVWKVGNVAMKITGLVVNNVAWVEAYLRTKWHFDSSMPRGLCPFAGKLGHLTKYRLGRGLPPYQVPS